MSNDSSATPQMLAPHHLRLFALIVDYLLVVVTLKLGHQVLLGSGWDLQSELVNEGAPGMVWLTALGILGLLKDAVVGRSPGKWLTGLAVVQADDPARVPTLQNRILRNALLPLLPLEAVLVFTNRYGRRLGDRLAGTVVVVSPKASPVGRRLLVLSIGFLASILIAFLITAWNLRRSDAYQTSVAVAAVHPAVIEAVGSPVTFGFSPEMELALPSRGSPGEAPDEEIGEGKAVLTLDVEGPNGEAKFQVSLRLKSAPKRWEVTGLQPIAKKGEEEIQELQPTDAPKR